MSGTIDTHPDMGGVAVLEPEVDLEGTLTASEGLLDEHEGGSHRYVIVSPYDDLNEFLATEILAYSKGATVETISESEQNPPVLVDVPEREKGKILTAVIDLYSLMHGGRITAFDGYQRLREDGLRFDHFYPKPGVLDGIMRSFQHAKKLLGQDVRDMLSGYTSQLYFFNQSR